MSVIPKPDLPPDENEVQMRAIELLRDERAKLVSAYRERFTIVVGTDHARELFPEYAENVGSRLKYALAVQRPAAALADYVFDQIVLEAQGGVALFTAGGTGAGKTNSIMRDGVTKDAFQGSRVIYDGNFNSFASNRDKIETALSRGCKVVVVFVHRHPVEAYIKGVIPRAREQGRTVSIQGHLRMHKDSMATFLKACRHFHNNHNVSFIVLNNTGHEQEAFRSSVDYLSTVKYDFPVLEETIRKGLDYEFEAKKISQALFDASCGDASSSKSR